MVTVRILFPTCKVMGKRAPGKTNVLGKRKLCACVQLARTHTWKLVCQCSACRETNADIPGWRKTNDRNNIQTWWIGDKCKHSMIWHINLPFGAFILNSNLKVENTTRCWNGMRRSHRSSIRVALTFSCVDVKVIVKDEQFSHGGVGQTFPRTKHQTMHKYRYMILADCSLTNPVYCSSPLKPIEMGWEWAVKTKQQFEVNNDAKREQHWLYRQLSATACHSSAMHTSWLTFGHKRRWVSTSRRCSGGPLSMMSKYWLSSMEILGR